MGAKLCKRGSYDFEKHLKSSNKLERRAISFISLTASEIYGDIVQDYYSVPQLHGELKEVHPAPPVTKRIKLFRHGRVTSESTSIKESGPQFRTVQDPRPSCHTISSDNDIFYDAVEYYDTISFTTEFDNAALATLVENTSDPVKHRNSSQSIVERELESSLEEDRLHCEDSIPKKIFHSTPDILIHSLEAVEQHNYEEIRIIQTSVTVRRSDSEEIVHVAEKVKNGTSNNASEDELLTRVVPEVEKAKDLEGVTEYKSEPLNDLQSRFTEYVTSKPDICDHSSFTTESQMENLTTKIEERSEWIDENNIVLRLKMIAQEVARLKTEIDGEIDYVNYYQNLMKVMMDVNAIKNEEFDEEVFSLQNETLAEIRACLEALKLKKEHR
ncbi:hypothetical protein PPYR_13268 [Photinus pyralis]|uniref:Uncharacterized protein n=2 Tax=Photinus pyralis TaxID=7054 RepID=A0A5N4A8R9_PHOPY|nr:uncharacterized protein LOC116178310 [Photinus pyralis]KAB0793648.1 hypothetical protein PPYR_13268 [Photinus pyralis]